MNSYGWTASLLLTLGVAVGEESPGEEVRPNIVFLLTDDQRWDTLGATGNTVIQTPNLDALAREGMAFREAFVTTSICSVSRASILSGQYARQHGIRDFDEPFSERALARTYPAVLRASGYYTGFIGKWGVGAKKSEHLEAASGAFDYWASLLQQGAYWHAEDCQFVTHAGADGFRKSLCDCGQGGPNERDTGDSGQGLHLTTQIIPDMVGRFLEGRDPEAPFCLSVSFKAPHGPLTELPPSVSGLYEGVEMPVPATATAAAASATPSFLSGSLGADKGRQMVTETGPASVLQVHLRDYYRLISGVDEAVGKIRALLAEHDLAESTVLVFTSDNGLMAGAHGLSGKWLMYEESIRVPMLILDPRLPAEQRAGVCDEMVLNIDIAPTLLELAGVERLEGMQGKSMLPLLATPDMPFRESWLYEHHFSPRGGRRIERSEGLRTRTMKYIRYIDQEPPYEELYDLAADPGETRNVSGVAEYGSALERLRREYMSLCDETAPGSRSGGGSRPEARSGRRKVE